MPQKIPDYRAARTFGPNAVFCLPGEYTPGYESFRFHTVVFLPLYRGFPNTSVFGKATLKFAVLQG
jgi:hypothetical protein